MQLAAVHPLNIGMRALVRPASHAAVSASSRPKSRVGVPIISEQGSRCAAPVSLPMLPERPRVPLRESALRSLSLASDPKHRVQRGGSEERKVLEVFEEGPMEASCRFHITATT